MKINKIQLLHLRNGVHFQFHTEFRDLVTKQGAEALKIEKQFKDYQGNYQILDEGLKKINKSAITEQIQEADKARDDIWYGILEMNKAAFRHFDSKVVEAAKRLKILFDSYGSGELANKPTNEQTAFTNNVLQELEGKYAEDVKLVGIEQWVAELKARNIVLDKLVKERFEESAAKSDIVVKDARAELDKSYNTIVERINAFAVVEDDVSIFEAFMKEFNVVVDKYATALKRGKNLGANNNVSETPEPKLD